MADRAARALVLAAVLLAFAHGLGVVLMLMLRSRALEPVFAGWFTAAGAAALAWLAAFCLGAAWFGGRDALRALRAWRARRRAS